MEMANRLTVFAGRQEERGQSLMASCYGVGSRRAGWCADSDCVQLAYSAGSHPMQRIETHAVLQLEMHTSVNTA